MNDVSGDVVSMEFAVYLLQVGEREEAINTLQVIN